VALLDVSGVVASRLGHCVASKFPSREHTDGRLPQFVAGFNNVDPGVEQVAQAFFNLNPAVVGATLGGVTSLNGKDLESFREHIPENVAQGIDSCLKKCGIKRNAKRDDFFLSN
jgi:hypothetical protein